MSDERTEAKLSAWLKESAVTAPNPERAARMVIASLESATQWPRSRQRRLGPHGFGNRSVAPRRLGTGLAAIVAIVLAGALGIALLVGSPAEAPVPLTPGAEDGDTRTIHWKSDVVDLSADSVTLRIGDETYTTEGADVVVDSSGYEGQFGLDLAWAEDGHTFRLQLGFLSDDEGWELEPSLWLDGRYRRDELVALQGRSASSRQPEPARITSREHVEFDPEGRIRMPLGEAYSGDWRLEGTIEVPVCGSEANQKVDVSLTFKNTTLVVTPRSPSFLDQIHDDYFRRGTLLGDLIDGPLDPPQPRPLDCTDE